MVIEKCQISEAAPPLAFWSKSAITLINVMRAVPFIASAEYTEHVNSIIQILDSVLTIIRYSTRSPLPKRLVWCKMQFMAIPFLANIRKQLMRASSSGPTSPILAKIFYLSTTQLISTFIIISDAGFVEPNLSVPFSQPRSLIELVQQCADIFSESIDHRFAQMALVCANSLEDRSKAWVEALWLERAITFSVQTTREALLVPKYISKLGFAPGPSRASKASEDTELKRWFQSI